MMWTPADIVTKTVEVAASPAKVWETLTTPELFQRWLTPTGSIIVTSEWKLGSAITFTGLWAGSEYRDKGVIVAFDPEKRFSYTHWNEISHLPDTPENYLVMDFELSPDGSGTRLTFTNSNLVTEAIYRHSAFYWNSTLHKIKQMAESL